MFLTVFQENPSFTLGILKGFHAEKPEKTSFPGNIK